MSKSLGTGIDPLELIERYGADAMRYGLLKMSSTQDVRFAEGMIDEGRGLTNKLWNAGRLILHERRRRRAPAPLAAAPVDGWMLTRLDRAIEEISALIDAYDFAAAVKALYRFVWNDVCDWYLEAAKARLYSDDPAERAQRLGDAALRARPHAAPLPPGAAARHRGALALRRRRRAC